MNFTLVDIEDIEADWLAENNISLNVLRLDKIDPIVSGNKWFKLKYYLKEAAELNKSTIATFGGAFSNHIIATAFAAKEAGFKSIGIIRGEKPAVLSHTLIQATKYGMELQFVSREQYRQKEAITKAFANNDVYFINEGGYGLKGAKGASEILKFIDISNYSHLIAAVGTGTMLAGLIMSVRKDQQVIGISSMKDNFLLKKQIEDLLETEAHFEIRHEYHFGGYGKHPQSLIDFINSAYVNHRLPLDIVYTGKTFYAIKDMVKKQLFAPGSKLLMIHSGGLQGNRSLPLKVLAF